MKKRLIGRHQIIKSLFLIPVLILLLFNPATSQAGEENLTTIVLVRHAEKMDDSNDPDLSEAGYERAKKLADLFINVEFGAVYSTDFIRTRETARPIAEVNNLSIQSYDYRNPAGEIENWLENHSGETILISGHSNSTPTFANAILGEDYFEEKFDESDYGNLLIITISDDGGRKLLHLRY